MSKTHTSLSIDPGLLARVDAASEGLVIGRSKLISLLLESWLSGATVEPPEGSEMEATQYERSEWVRGQSTRAQIVGRVFGVLLRISVRVDRSYAPAQSFGGVEIVGLDGHESTLMTLGRTVAKTDNPLVLADELWERAKTALGWDRSAS